MEGFSATHHELISPKRPFVSTYTVSSSDEKSDSSSESRTSPVIFQYGKNASTVSVSPIMISSEPASDSKTSPVFFQYGTLPQHRLTSRSSHSPPPPSPSHPWDFPYFFHPGMRQAHQSIHALSSLQACFRMQRRLRVLERAGARWPGALCKEGHQSGSRSSSKESDADGPRGAPG